MGAGVGVRIDLDALMAFPVEEVERVLAATGRGSRRKRKLPAHVMVYYVIALGLLASVGARDVLRRVLHRAGQEFSFTLATDAAITKARQRLGWAPLKALFEDYVRPIATRRMSWAWFKGRRLVALDGSTLNVIDSRANVRAFGKPPSSRGQTVFAQIRWVALAEIGTHVLFAARMAGWRVQRVCDGSAPGEPPRTGDALFGRPSVLWIPDVEQSCRNRGGSALARPETHPTATSTHSQGSFVSERSAAAKHRTEEGPGAVDSSPRRGVRRDGSRTSRTLPLDHHAAQSATGNSNRAGPALRKTLEDRDHLR
jgi:hypothetical protein